VTAKPKVYRMTTTTKGRYGFRSKYLGFAETLSQSVANISPTLTPVVIVPLVFASAGNGTWIAYLFAMIGMLLVGANINQFAKRSATPGSLYSFVTRGLGVNAGFLSGWCLILAYLLTATAVLAGAVNYAGLLLDMVHLHPPTAVLFAIGCATAWFIAFRDVKLSTRIMLALEVMSMALILILGVLVLQRHHTAIDLDQFDVRTMDFSGLKAGLILAVFSYVGFESATTLGEEAKNPLKSIPRAVLLSTAISGVFFIVSAYIAVLGFKAMGGSLATSTAPFNELASNLNLDLLGILISIGAVVSLFACTLANVTAASRIIYSMGRHGIFHPHLATAHKTNDTPHNATTMASSIIFILAFILLSLGRSVLEIFNDLSTIATYGFLTVYALICVAAPMYLQRRKQLTAGAIGLAIISIAFLIPAIIATVYPAPAAPANVFPVYFLGYVILGILWYALIRSRASSTVLAQIEHDLALDHPEHEAQH
jgi:amino acid transporter